MAPGSMRAAVNAEVGQMRDSTLTTRLIESDQDSLRIVNGLVNGAERYLTSDAAGLSGEENPGGVLLDRPAEVLFNLSNIRAAVFDRAAARLVLIGEQNTLMPAVVPQYLTVGLKCATERDGPGVSIDPSRTAGQMTVRYIGPVEGTAVGYVMFEADRLLKSLSLGRDNVTGEPLSCPIPGFLTVPELMKSSFDWSPSEDAAFLRFWFVPRRVAVQLNQAGNAAVFEEVALEAKEEVLAPNAPEAVHEAAADFARFFTEHYDEFAMEYSALAELKQVAQAVALARWLVDEGIPVPSSLLTVDDRDVETPTSTPAIAVGLNARGVGGATFRIVGGVDLCSPGTENQYTRAWRTPGLAAAALRHQSAGDEHAWAVTHDGAEYVGVSLAGGFMEVPRRGGSGARARALIAVGAASTVLWLLWLRSRR